MNHRGYYHGDFITFRAAVRETPEMPKSEISTYHHRDPNVPRSFYVLPVQSIYGNKAGQVNLEGKIDSADSQEQQQGRGNASKTPFTKLSSFKFRKELGRGAFGRVLLAEAKTDGRLYALKIISKKNMRSSDKRQAKAERDILYAMTLKAPHPFTSGLKFAFQSENNLYLGMDFIPGGNLRELIKRFKYLPEVRCYRFSCCICVFFHPGMHLLSDFDILFPLVRSYDLL